MSSALIPARWCQSCATIMKTGMDGLPFRIKSAAIPIVLESCQSSFASTHLSRPTIPSKLSDEGVRYLEA